MVKYNHGKYELREGLSGTGNDSMLSECVLVMIYGRFIDNYNSNLHAADILLWHTLSH